MSQKNFIAIEFLDLYQKDMAEWNTIQLLFVPLRAERVQELIHSLRTI